MESLVRILSRRKLSGVVRQFRGYAKEARKELLAVEAELVAMNLGIDSVSVPLPDLPGSALRYRKYSRSQWGLCVSYGTADVYARVRDMNEVELVYCWIALPALVNALLEAAVALESELSEALDQARAFQRRLKDD